MSDLPRGSFGAIVADPPWRFATWSDAGKGKSPENHYETMTVDDIANLPVWSLALPNCALFLWATMPMLPEALRVIHAWGFEYKTVAFTWAKRSRTDSGWHFGCGYWTRANAELCLLGTRGHPLRKSRAVRQLIVAPVREHSRKPVEALERVETLVGGPYLELFARERRPGWTTWGDEVGLFDAAQLESEVTP